LSIEDLFRRWSIREQTIPTVPRLERVVPLVAGTPAVNWDSLNSLFLFNSGSVRYKLLTTSTAGELTAVLQSVNDTDGIHDLEQVDAGAARTDVSRWPLLDFCVPYVAGFDVQVNPGAVSSFSNQTRFEFNFGMTTDSEPVVQQWIKAAANYQVFFLMPVPLQSLWPWNNPAALRKVSSVNEAQALQDKQISEMWERKLSTPSKMERNFLRKLCPTRYPISVKIQNDIDNDKDYVNSLVRQIADNGRDDRLEDNRMFTFQIPEDNLALRPQDDRNIKTCSTSDQVAGVSPTPVPSWNLGAMLPSFSTSK